jgi:5-methylthioadenosine/S-adenosylhomocysteine deaminase
MEYLTSGITSNFDMYFYQGMNAKAAVDVGFRSVFTSGLNNFSESLERVEEDYLRTTDMSDLVSYIIGFHAEYTTSKELMEGIAGLAQKYKSPVYTHNSETALEVKECIDRWGMTPTGITDSLGMYEYGGGGYHVVHMSDDDFEIFKKRGLYAVTNPGSNTKLASGIAPIKEYLEWGIPVAIGTDGPASNNCLDMFREMFLVTGLAKLKNMDASSVEATEVLKMATVNGAHAMGLMDADVLAEGKLADIIMLDLYQPNMQPINNIQKNIVYSGSKSNVMMTMIGGIIRYENGRFNIGEEPSDIYKKAEEISKRIYS